MAKKKPNRDGGRSPRRRPNVRGYSFSDPFEVPDPRILEAEFRQMLDRMAPVKAEAGTPTSLAQGLLQVAYREPSPEGRAELARQALAADPDCADALVLLAELSHHRREATELYEKAVQAAERTLEPKMFRETAGRFCSVQEKQPYLRARLGLAHALWTSGRQEEAVEHARDMLRLNPGDNQGIRYTLAAWLLNLDRDEELTHLLDDYRDEDSATWAYTRALLAFRRDGDTSEARTLLKQAKKANKRVPDYLLEKKRLPAHPPAYHSPGTASEAIDYAGGFLAAWRNTAGALDWLREATTSTRKKRATALAAQGPTPTVLARLKRLPQRGDAWMADCRQLPTFVEDQSGRPVRPWIILVLNLDRELILAQQITEDQPTSQELWDTLAQAMQKPFMGDKQRPTELQVRAGAGWEGVHSALEDLGIHPVTADELKPIDALVGRLAESLGGEQSPALVDLPGVTLEQVGRFFEAAADFFRQSPWRRLGYENAIRIACPALGGGPWFAVLMGQSGLARGVALYDDFDLLKRLWAEELTDEENAEQSVATTVIFGDDEEIALADLEAARQHGWPVVRPDAYPSIFHKERGLSMRPPTAQELERMEACLRGLPEFVLRRRQEDTTPERITVITAAGERTLTLSWSQPEGP